MRAHIHNKGFACAGSPTADLRELRVFLSISVATSFSLQPSAAQHVVLQHIPYPVKKYLATYSFVLYSRKLIHTWYWYMLGVKFCVVSQYAPSRMSYDGRK